MQPPESIMTQQELPEIKLDTESLYMEETFSDRKAGTLRRLMPVKKDGSADDSRPVLFLGQTQLMTQMGVLPISFEVEAQTLEEALEKFPEAAKEGIKRTIEEIQEMRREAASSIVVPGRGTGGLSGTGGPGGIPGGGLQMP